MQKACSRCGKIHSYNYKCNKGKTYKHNDIDKLRSSTSWTIKSIEIRELSHYLCAVCKEEGMLNYEDIQVHHIEKLQDRPDLLLENENLICLCRKHHKEADEGKIEKNYLINLVEKRDRHT